MQEQLAKVLAPYKDQRGAIIPVLQEVQESLGYLPKEAIFEIAKFLGMSASEVFGVATFYAQFRFIKPGRHSVKVCLGTACHVRGGQRILERVMDELRIHESGAVTEDYRYGLDRVACFGCCALGPVVVVDNDVYSKMTPISTLKMLERYE